MRKVLKITGRILIFLIISILLGGNVFLLNAKFVMHEQLPMLGGYGYAIVLSGSMQQTFDVNDLLIIQKCDTYEPGDIVSFVDKKNTLVTHRLVSIDYENKTMITRGDANNVDDEPLEPDRIKGKVINILPGFGRFVDLLQNPICVVTVLVVLIFLMERSYSKERKRRKEGLDSIRAEIELLKAQTSSPSYEGSTKDIDTDAAGQAAEITRSDGTQAEPEVVSGDMETVTDPTEDEPEAVSNDTTEDNEKTK